MQEVFSDFLYPVTSYIKASDVVNFSATCRRFRLFYSPLRQYLKQLSHPDVFIQLRTLHHILENIPGLLSQRRLCGSVLNGYLSNITSWGYLNHRILINMILLILSKDIRHAHNITHLVQKEGKHPLILRFITEKLKLLSGASNNFHEALAELKQNLTSEQKRYGDEMEFEFGFSNLTLLSYIPLFYSDLNEHDKLIVMRAARDRLAEKGPELNTMGIKWYIANMKLIALSISEQNMRVTFAKSLIKPFTATSHRTNTLKYMDTEIVDLVIRMAGSEFFSTLIRSGITGVFHPMGLLSHLLKTHQFTSGKVLLLNNWGYFINHIVDDFGMNKKNIDTLMGYIQDETILKSAASGYFQNRLLSAKTTGEMIGCYQTVLIIENILEHDALWGKLYRTIMNEFASGKHDIRWVYADMFTPQQVDVLETKLIETFSNYVEDNPVIRRGLSDYDWSQIKIKSICTEHRALAVLKLAQKTAVQQKTGQMSESAEALWQNIVNHDRDVQEGVYKYHNTDAVFLEHVKQFYQNFPQMHDRFLEQCYPLLYSVILKYFDDRLSRYDFFCRHAKNVLAYILEILPDKFADIVIRVLETGSNLAIQKATEVLNNNYPHLPNKLTRRCAEKLVIFLTTESTIENDKFDTISNTIIEFLSCVSEHLGPNQLLQLASLNTNYQSLFVFLIEATQLTNHNRGRNEFRDLNL